MFNFPQVYRILADARRMLEVPAVHLNGYNFANQGIQGIWEGFQSSIPDAPPSNSPRGIPLLEPLLVEGVQTISRSQSRRGRNRADVPSDFAAALLLLKRVSQGRRGRSRVIRLATNSSNGKAGTTSVCTSAMWMEPEE
jgi:hypothetical protein